MHQGFKDYLLNDALHWSDEDKKAALEMLKCDPGLMKTIIMNNIIGWATAYVFKHGEQFSTSDTRTDTDELMNAYRELFKDELDAMV